MMSSSHFVMYYVVKSIIGMIPEIKYFNHCDMWHFPVI